VLLARRGWHYLSTKFRRRLRTAVSGARGSNGVLVLTGFVTVPPCHDLCHAETPVRIAFCRASFGAMAYSWNAFPLGMRLPWPSVESGAMALG